MSTRIPHVEYRFEAASLVWRVRHVRLREALDTPFDGSLQLLCDADISTAELVGADATLTITRGDTSRTFRGEITRADVRAGSQGTVAFVRFESPLARLDRGHHHRIFQGVTPLEIVRELVAQVGPLGDGVAIAVATDAAGPTSPREYCVQYDETDLAFVRRLLEDEGRAWFVSDDGTSPTLHIVEGNASYAAPAGADGIYRIIEDRFDEASEESVQSLALHVQGRTVGVVERAWEWGGTPHVAEARSTAAGSAQPDPEAAATHHLQHLRRGSAADVTTSAQREYQRLDVRRFGGAGRSNATAFAAGTRVTIVTPPGDEIALLLTGVEHVGDCPEAELAGGAGAATAGPNYANTFECRPLDVPYRPQRQTPRPKIHGLQTAVVVGPAKEEIHTDEHGRIRVRMHWDRAGTPDVDASCWIRVAQSWAGNGWGSMVIPRVGMEVLVAFLDGDPDRPLCVGCVYNGAHRPPNALPDERTKSTFRSSSTPGGEGYNELTFEDAAGAEQVYVRAQRDLSTQVLRNESRSVGADQSIHIGHDQSVTIDGDQHVTLKGNQTVTIDGGGTEGLAGSAVAVKGEVEVKVTEPGRIVIDAAECIELRVGATRILIDEGSIRMLAGGGAIAHMNESIMLLAEGGAMARMGASVDLRSAAGAQVTLDKVSAVMQSPTGARVTLDDTATIASSLADEELKLAGGATLRAATIGLEAAAGATLQLDMDAAIEGGQVRSLSANGSLSLTSGGAKLDGTTVDIAAATMATMISALVKIN